MKAEGERERQRRDTGQTSAFKVSALFNEVILAHSQLVTGSKIISTLISELSIVESSQATDINPNLHIQSVEQRGLVDGGGGVQSSSHYWNELDRQLH